MEFSGDFVAARSNTDYLVYSYHIYDLDMVLIQLALYCSRQRVK